MAEPDETGTSTTPEPPPPERPARRRRRTGTAPKPPARVERRAEKSAQTIRELVRLRRPDMDVDGLSFLEVVDRDADAWGRALAQLAEWVVPFGRLVDLVFGSPVALLVSLAPSVRAARRDLSDRRQARRQKRAAPAEEPVYDEQGNLVLPDGYAGE